MSGPATPLREIRAALPTARYRPAVTTPRFESKRGGQPPASQASVAPPGAALLALTYPQRLTVIDQALLMLEALYAHLPLKRARHATDPIQKLRLLRLRHEALDEREFQSEMIDIFVGLRDLHTNYILPAVYHRKFAYLPFRIEEFYEAGERRYLVSWVSPRNTEATLVSDVEVTHWNGMPIDLRSRATPHTKPAATRKRADVRASPR